MARVGMMQRLLARKLARLVDIEARVESKEMIDQTVGLLLSKQVITFGLNNGKWD